MKKFIFVWLFFLATFNAQGCSKTLTVGTNETYWPPYVVSNNQTLTGVEIDVINAIFKDSAFCLKFSVLPNSLRAFEELKNGHIDMVFAASKTPGRSNYAYFSSPYRVEVMRLYRHKNSPNIQSLRAIFNKSLTVGVNRGSFLGNNFERLRSRFPNQVVQTEESFKRFLMLYKQRIDYTIDDSLVAKYFAKKYNTLMPAEFVAPININNVHFMLSKKSVTVSDVALINALISKNKEVIQRIYSAY